MLPHESRCLEADERGPVDSDGDFPLEIVCEGNACPEDQSEGEDELLPLPVDDSPGGDDELGEARRSAITLMHHTRLDADAMGRLAHEMHMHTPHTLACGVNMCGAGQCRQRTTADS